MREQLRPNEQRAKAAIDLIWIVMSINIIILILSVAEVFFLMQDANGQEVSQTAVDICNTLLGIADWFIFIAFVLSAITFIRWFRRAYYNLHTIAGKTEYSAGWAAGSWFIPFVNLYIPYSIMKELYEKTDQYLAVHDNIGYSADRLRTDYVGWWWALCIICTIIGNITLKITFNTQLGDDVMFGKIVNIVYLLLFIVLSFVTVIVIRDYADVESQLFEIEGDTDSEVEVSA
ncbi:MAG: DUF4328 domain-containing protein [Dysgonomonas sp.]